MLLGFIFYSEYFEYSENTDHDESVLVSMMRIHKFGDFPSEIRHEDEKEENNNHEWLSISLRPFSKDRIIWLEIFGLEESKSANNKDKKEGKNTRFRHTENNWFCHFGESFFEHLKCCEEDYKKSEPLDGRVFLKHLGNPSWGNDHENNGDNKSYAEVHHISMTCSCDREDIIEGHSNISDNYRLDGCREGISFFSSFFMVFVSTDFTIKLPYDIEEEDSTEEFESWNLHEPYRPKWEDDSENGCSCYSPEYCFGSFSSLEFFGCHTDEDSIISTHHEVYEDDIEEREESCGGAEMY